MEIEDDEVEKRLDAIRKEEEENRHWNQKVSHEASWLCSAFKKLSTADRVKVIRLCYYNRTHMGTTGTDKSALASCCGSESTTSSLLP